MEFTVEDFIDDSYGMMCSNSYQLRKAISLSQQKKTLDTLRRILLSSEQYRVSYSYREYSSILPNDLLRVT